MTNLINPRALFSPIYRQTYSLFHESGSDNQSQTYNPKKFFKIMAARHLGFDRNRIAPFDPPIPKTPRWNQNKVDRMTYCWDIVIRNFSNERSVGRSVVSIYTVSHNYSNPYEKWNIFVARPHLWLQLGMVKLEIILRETLLNLSTLNTLTYLLTY